MKQKIRIGQGMLILFFFLISLFMLYPLWYCLAGSLMSYSEYMQTQVVLLPKQPTLEAYRYIFEQGEIFSPLLVTLFVTVVGTLCNLFVTTLGGYALSKSFPGARVISGMLVLTLFVYAGVIPEYVVNKQLGLLDTLSVYIIPTLVNAYYLVIVRTFFRDFPVALEESAMLDGCSAFKIFLRIVLPLSKPLIASVGMFLLVDYWNIFQPSLYFITSRDKRSLQHYLYSMINAASSANVGGTQLAGGEASVFSSTVKMANTVLTMIPILSVYPFLQKYFSSGIMLGAVKG